MRISKKSSNFATAIELTAIAKLKTYYNLDVIIPVGYRVKSQRGVQFRQWATKRIHEYIVKGFTLDDEREMIDSNRQQLADEFKRKS